MSELLNQIRDRAIAPSEIAELQLLAQRAEASVDASMANVRYTSVRGVYLQAEQDRGAAIKPFNMFAVSVVDPTVPFGKSAKDIMFCRTPEIAKFIVALLNFGGAVVAEHSGQEAEQEPKPTLHRDSPNLSRPTDCDGELQSMEERCDKCGDYV